MAFSRALVLLCVAAAAVLSEAPGAGVSAELAPLRQLEEAVVKVHVKLHQNEVVAALEEHATDKKHAHKKSGGTEEDGETVHNYDHGSVHIESKGANFQQTHGAKRHHQTVAEYEHGSVKISGKKKSTQNKAKKAAAPNEEEVTSTANEVNELVTKLSSTGSEDKKSFVDAYGPVVVICGIIGGLAAIVGVAGLVVGQTPKTDDNFDSVLGASADLDVDVEANITSAGVQGGGDEDAVADSDEFLDDSSDSDAIDEEEEEGTFANGTVHVSV
jgi:hypothetical protein